MTDLLKNKDLLKLGLYNLKIHYIWTFFSSILFLSPVMSLYYKFYGLGISDIIMINGIFFFFSFVLDIPTSTLGDHYPRTKILLASVLFSLVPIIIYLLFPIKIFFFIAIFFAALGNALWSGTGHAKLQEDLQAAGKQKDFGKVIGRLIAIQNFGTLFTPVMIFFVLKYFPESGYKILAGLDLIIRFIVIFWVSRFKELDGYDKKIDLLKDLKDHAEVFKNAFNYFIKNKILLGFLFISLFAYNIGFIQSISLPIISDFGIKDYNNSIFLWIYTLILMIGSLLSYKISAKIGNWKFFGILMFFYFVLHVLYFFFFKDFLYFIILTSFLYLFIGFLGSLWNHIFMDISDIKEKATLRSLVLSIIFLYKGICFWIFSKIPMQWSLMILSIQFLIGFLIFLLLVSRNSSLVKKQTNE